MGRRSNISFLLAFFIFLAGCSVQEPAVEQDVSETVIPEAMGEDRPEEEVAAEPDNIIPSVTDEVVDAQESPFEAASEMPKPEEPAGMTEEPRDVATEAAAELDDANATEPDEAQRADEAVSDEQNGSRELSDIPSPAEEPAVPEIFKPFTEQIGVLKIEVEADALRIKMNDPIVKYFSLPSPERIVIDFKDIRYLDTKEQLIVSPCVSKIATAAHDNYNRVVIYLTDKLEYTISKESGGWLVRFKK